MSKPPALDAMLAADGELDRADQARLPEDAAATQAAVRELGELVRGHLELATDEAEPRLAGLWELVERRLDAEAATPAPAPAPVVSPSLWSRAWSWLAGHSSHVATGLVSAGAVGALALAFRPAGPERVVVKPMVVPPVAPLQLTRTPPEVESLELIGGSGTVFTIDDDEAEGSAAVIWVEPDEIDPTEGI